MMLLHRVERTLSSLSRPHFYQTQAKSTPQNPSSILLLFRRKDLFRPGFDRNRRRFRPAQKKQKFLQLATPCHLDK
jgi:hypothetical protein